jgi:diketogulonate reductase-like aldo/keto reductase
MSAQDWLTTSAGVKMPRIIYGTAWKKERTAELVAKALQAGFRGIDTACQPKHYDEQSVGVALRRMQEQGIAREAVFLQTKFTPLSSQDPEQVPYNKSSPLASQVAQSFETSTSNLQTDYVDSLILHSPLASHELTMTAWRAMEEIYRSGGARQLGISNCYDMDKMISLYRDAGAKPAVLQNRFSPETGYGADLRNWCGANGVIFQSFWSLTANPRILASDTVQHLALKYKKSAAQIFFRYLSQNGIVPLSGTCSEQHMKEDIEIFDFELSSAELNEVNLLLKQK